VDGGVLAGLDGLKTSVFDLLGPDERLRRYTF